jgi:hypothetical protein
MMNRIFNIINSFFEYLFNLFIEFKYFKNKLNKDTSISSIYFIYDEQIEEHTSSINELNRKLKYSSHISLNFLKEYIKNNGIIQINYTKNNREYIVNFDINNNSPKDISFPIYSKEMILRRNANKIVDINCTKEDRNELLSLLDKYSGPLNDFYLSKDNGIPLNRIYSYKLFNFPFKGKKYIFEDSFLNEYEMESENVLKIKNTLDETKINDNNQNEQFILNKFNNFKLDGKMMFYGIIQWIFGNKKEE